MASESSRGEQRRKVRSQLVTTRGAPDPSGRASVVKRLYCLIGAPHRFTQYTANYDSLVPFCDELISYICQMELDSRGTARYDHLANFIIYSRLMRSSIAHFPNEYVVFKKVSTISFQT